MFGTVFRGTISGKGGGRKWRGKREMGGIKWGGNGKMDEV